jgi:hypothetical protein
MSSVVVGLVGATAATARAEPLGLAAPSRPTTAASVGLKTGMFPPVLAAAELAYQWAPAKGSRFGIGFGVFGCYAPVGVGEGHHRMLLGAEMLFADDVTRSSWVGELGYSHYRAWPDAAGLHESSHTLTAVGGYAWKWTSVQLYAESGVGWIVADSVGACAGPCRAFNTRFFPMMAAGIRYVF